jgi:cytochrome c oxidase subunit II
VEELLRRMLALPPQASTVAQGIDRLHYFVILTTMVGSVAVAAVAAYFLLKYRRPSDVGQVTVAPREGVFRGVPLWAEITVIVGLLGLFLLWWAIGFRQFVRLRVPPPDAMEIYVSGKQWMWTFSYPDGTGSNGVLYVPASRPVKLVLTSRDVIHSFFVPDFRVKMDAIPGRLTSLWFEVERPGVHQILCTEYCGTGHSTMRGQVVALREEDYDDWRRQQQEVRVAAVEYTEPAVIGVAPAQQLTLAEMGERVANIHGCLRCHTADGSPHIGPTFARLYGSQSLQQTGEMVIVDGAHITRSIMDPMAQVRVGYAPLMPSYQGLITAPEIAAIVEYIKALAVVPEDLRQAPPTVSPPVPTAEEDPTP